MFAHAYYYSKFTPKLTNRHRMREENMSSLASEQEFVRFTFNAR